MNGPAEIEKLDVKTETCVVLDKSTLAELRIVCQSKGLRIRPTLERLIRYLAKNPDKIKEMYFTE
jgi:hypothetical protein